MNSSTSEEGATEAPAPITSSGPALALALCLIAIGAASFFTSSNRGVELGDLKDSVQLNPPDWSPSDREAATLKQLASERRAASVTDKEPLAKRLLERLEEFHRIGLMPGGNRRSPSFQDAHAHYTQRAQDFLKHRGRDAFMALGQWVVDGYMTALKAGDKRTLESLGGPFYRHAKSSRLIGDNGMVGPAEERIIRLLLMEAWLYPITRTEVVEAWLHPLERVVLRRWKLVAQNLSPERRMGLARELERLKSGYPVWWAMGWHAAEARDWVAAAAFYEKALGADSENRTLRLNLEYAQERARRNQ